MEGLIAVNEEQIRQVAYDLWEREGRPRGRELDHYYRAQQLVTQKRFEPVDSSTVEPERAQSTNSQTAGTSATGSAAIADASIGAKPAKRPAAKKAAAKPRSKRA